MAEGRQVRTVPLVMALALPVLREAEIEQATVIRRLAAAGQGVETISRATRLLTEAVRQVLSAASGQRDDAAIPFSGDRAPQSGCGRRLAVSGHGLLTIAAGHRPQRRADRGHPRGGGRRVTTRSQAASEKGGATQGLLRLPRMATRS